MKVQKLTNSWVLTLFKVFFTYPMIQSSKISCKVSMRTSISWTMTQVVQLEAPTRGQTEKRSAAPRLTDYPNVTILLTSLQDFTIPLSSSTWLCFSRKLLARKIKHANNFIIHFRDFLKTYLKLPDFSITASKDYSKTLRNSCLAVSTKLKLLYLDLHPVLIKTSSKPHKYPNFILLTLRC